jgi:thymidylate synthase ThyX
MFKKEYPKIYQTFEKKAIENARYVYPQALATKLVCTFNARSFLNFNKNPLWRYAVGGFVLNSQSIFNLLRLIYSMYTN